MAINPQAVRGPITAVTVVAGKGVRFVEDVENNRVVAEADETELFRDASGSNSTCTLSEAYSNFERIRVSFRLSSSTSSDEYSSSDENKEFYTEDILANNSHNLTLSINTSDGNGTGITKYLQRTSWWKFNTTTSLGFRAGVQFYQSVTGTSNTNMVITRVVGINRVASA